MRLHQKLLLKIDNTVEKRRNSHAPKEEQWVSLSPPVKRSLAFSVLTVFRLFSVLERNSKAIVVYFVISNKFIPIKSSLLAVLNN